MKEKGEKEFTEEFGICDNPERKVKEFATIVVSSTGEDFCEVAERLFRDAINLSNIEQ